MDKKEILEKAEVIYAVFQAMHDKGYQFEGFLDFDEKAIKDGVTLLERWGNLRVLMHYDMFEMFSITASEAKKKLANKR
ncbi:MAG: hypothetical protein HZC16_03745 [Candidatus Omnitrophica bacterium]|nr:hypothetical protein [Candidatus Omnitrophota bacterium]